MPYGFTNCCLKMLIRKREGIYFNFYHQDLTLHLQGQALQYLVCYVYVWCFMLGDMWGGVSELCLKCVAYVKG